MEHRVELITCSHQRTAATRLHSYSDTQTLCPSRKPPAQVHRIPVVTAGNNGHEGPVFSAGRWTAAVLYCVQVADVLKTSHWSAYSAFETGAKCAGKQDACAHGADEIRL